MIHLALYLTDTDLNNAVLDRVRKGFAFMPDFSKPVIDDDCTQNDIDCCVEAFTEAAHVARILLAIHAQRHAEAAL